MEHGVMPGLRVPTTQTSGRSSLRLQCTLLLSPGVKVLIMKLYPSSRRGFLLGMAAAAAPGAMLAQTGGRPGIHDVHRYGAAGDGVHVDTGAIQAAVDRCAQSGGGTVLFRSGVYLSGTIVLKSNVSLQIRAGAVLRGSPNLADYPVHVPALRSYTDTYTDKSLIYAENVENISIRGQGTIDGQGSVFKGAYKLRPYLMRFINCRNLQVEDVTLRDSAMWVQHYLACEQVAIRGVIVHSRVNINNDGIDIDSCHGVRISDCDIWSGDDAIVLKATTDRPCSNVVVSNCVLSSDCNALKLGTESNGGFENVAFTNCAVSDTRLAGLAIEMVDGGVLDRINVTNIVMKGVGAPIFIRLGDRARPFIEGGARPPVGTLRNVLIRGLQADGAGPTGCAIAGLPGQKIENVTLDDIRLSFAGGGMAADVLRGVAEKADGYPEFSMFGKLPAYGFFCRHVRNLRLNNIQTGCIQLEERPAVAAEDVDTADLAECAFDCAPQSRSAVWLNGARHVFAHGCRTTGPIGVWMRVTGAGSREIRLQGNDLSGARKAAEASSDVPPDAIAVDPA
jgi:polygalacturonase